MSKDTHWYYAHCIRDVRAAVLIEQHRVIHSFHSATGTHEILAFCSVEATDDAVVLFKAVFAHSCIIYVYLQTTLGW